MHRHVCRVCSDCWYRLRPGDYMPDTDVWDIPCCGCGDVTQTARVTRAEADERAATLWDNPDDRPHASTLA